MIVYLIKMLICSGALYFLYHLLLRKETYFHLNRVYLWAILFVSITIPLLHFSLAERTFTESFLYSFINSTQELFFVIWLDEVVISAKAPYSFDWVQLLEVTYIIGIFVFFMRIPVFAYRILYLRLKSRKYKVGNISLFVHSQPFTAFSFGGGVYVNKQELKKKNFKVVWKHELEHIKYGHTIESFFLEVFCCLFWFNPFVWAIKYRLKEIHEYQVDMSVIKQGVNTLDYQKHLVNYILDGDLFVGGSHFAATIVKRRIQMLVSKPSSLSKRMRFLAVVPVFVLLLAAFSFQSAEGDINTILPQKVIIEEIAIEKNKLFDTIPSNIEEKVK